MARAAGHCQENRKVIREVEGGAAVTSIGRRKCEHIDKKSSGRVSQKSDTPIINVGRIRNAERAAGPHRLAVSIINIKVSSLVVEAANAVRTAVHPDKKEE